jgi:NADH-quinone oxidoreductase subunit L
MLIGALSMAGFPGLSIFWSKDAVLEAAWHAGSENTLFLVLFVLGLLTAFMTAFYMFRLWFMTFWGDYRGARHAEPHGTHTTHHAEPHESPPRMTYVLLFLSVFAALWGLAALLGGLGGFVAYSHDVHQPTLVEAVLNPVSMMSIVVGLAGIGLAYGMYATRAIPAERVAGSGVGAGLHNLLTQRYYMDHGYNWVAGRAYVAFANAIDWFDRNVLDGIVNGTAWVHLRTSETWRKAQSGNVQDYTGVLVAGVVVVAILALYVVNPSSFLNPTNEASPLHRFWPGGA